MQYGGDSHSSRYNAPEQPQQWSDESYRQPGGDWQAARQAGSDDWDRGYRQTRQRDDYGNTRIEDRPTEDAMARSAGGRTGGRPRYGYEERYASGAAGQEGRYAQVGHGYSGHSGFGGSDYDRNYDAGYRYSGPEGGGRDRDVSGMYPQAYGWPGAQSGGRFARDYGREEYRDHERGFLQRSRDEIASWFGDDDAARRREIDHRGRGPSGYKRSDERIREDACDRLTEDWAIDASDITVDVKDGEVTLNGHVDNRQAKRRAEDCVDHISGVGHVQNNLRVKNAAAREALTSGNNPRAGTEK